MVKSVKQNQSKTTPLEPQRQEAAANKVPATGKPQELVTASDDMEALLTRAKSEPGGGLSKDQSDNLVPLIYLLQPLSPQVMKGDAARIDGAEAGDIWLRNSEPPIISGDDGMLFQPCYFWKDIVEWIPDRGGFVGRHDISCLPNVSLNKGWTGTLSDVKEVTDEDEPNAFPRYVRSSNNNEVVETRYFAGYVYPEGGLPQPFIIPLASTGHSFGKQWMFLQNAQVLPDGTPCDKSWVFLYRLKTTMKTNKKGSWYTYTVMKERMVKGLDEYERGSTLNKAFVSGEKRPDDDQMDRGSTGTGPVDSGTLSNDE